MDFLKQYLINISSLKEGLHAFDFVVDNELFKYFGYDEFNSCKIKVNLKLNKKSTLIELGFLSKGIINLNCFVSNEEFDYPHNSNMNLVVKFGERFNDDNDELLILPKGTYQIDISQQIYEMIVLSLPLKIIHPGIEDGTLEFESLNMFNKNNSNTQKDISIIDKRWDKLKDLK